MKYLVSYWCNLRGSVGYTLRSLPLIKYTIYDLWATRFYYCVALESVIFLFHCSVGQFLHFVFVTLLYCLRISYCASCALY